MGKSSEDYLRIRTRRGKSSDICNMQTIFTEKQSIQLVDNILGLNIDDDDNYDDIIIIIIIIIVVVIIIHENLAP